MSFLEELDRRAEAQARGRGPTDPVPEGEPPENRELLDFADLVRARRALPDAAGRERVMERIRRAGLRAASGRWPRHLPRRLLLSAVAAAAAVLVSAALLGAFRRGPVVTPTEGPDPGRKKTVDGTGAKHRPVVARPPRRRDEFAGLAFPEPKPPEAGGAGAVEKPRAADASRLLRCGGLVMVRRKGEERWRLVPRGGELAAGDALRTGGHAGCWAVVLGPDGSRLALAAGTELASEKPRAWRLERGRARFSVARGPGLGAFTVTTPDGSARALGTEFTLSVEPAAAGRKAATVCRVSDGRVALTASGGELALDAGGSGALSGGRALAWSEPAELAWLRQFEDEPGSGGGVGELLARVVDGKGPAQPLEVKSHRVTVTAVDQVARTFIDEEFSNNTGSRMEGTFYYPLPPDAAISEFAMYVDGVRVEGEVLEQHRARQIFEYIVRQQRDPALLEFAGGNLFKMRIFPIEPHSTKRIQLGYTQVLPRRDGLVSYSYPLVSEKLLKNPLHELSIDFRVLSSHGLEGLTSPTHKAAMAVSKDGLSAALAFRAAEYSPTRDFAVTYRVPRAPECATFGHGAGEEDGGRFFMLQLCPQAELPSRPAPERLLVVVDGSASAGAQEYAVAAELAGSIADMSPGCRLALLRGGQKPELLPGGFVPADTALPAKVRHFLAARPPMGATDLVATFRAAAEAVKPGERVQLLYVGDGVDTLGELEGGALVGAILRLFEGRHVEISCAAVGSSYDRAVLAGLAGGTGGSFVRVTGAADVHGAAGQVADGFWTPMLRRVRVEVENLAAADVYPSAETSLGQGDTLVVLGRAGKAGRGRVTLRAEAGGRAFEKRWDVELETPPDRNRFLPRLWAKAHIDALLEEMGTGGAAADARLRGKVIETSLFYQIMSPFTAFLVLESESDYARFGIKRKARTWDWHGDAEGIGSTAIGPRDQFKKDGEQRMSELIERPMVVHEQPGPDATPMPGPASRPSVPIQSEALDDWAELRERAMVPLSKRAELLSEDAQFTDWDGYRSVDMDGDGVVDRSESMRVFDGRDMKKRIADFPGPEFGLEKSRLPVLDELPVMGRLFLEREEESKRKSYRGYYKGRGRYWQYGGAQHVSPILSAGAVVGLKVDQPLQSSAVYRRLAAKGDASLTLMLNLALALGQEGRLAEATKALDAVIAKLPELPDLWLELGALRHRSGDAEGAKKAFARALELAPEKDREAIRNRITGFYSNANDYQGAAESFEAMARAAAAEPETAAAHLGNAANWWRNAGDETRARAALAEVAGTYEKLARAAAAEPQKAAAHFATAAQYYGNAGEAARSRALWLESVAGYEKLAAAAGTDDVGAAGYLNMAARWLQSAGEKSRAGELFVRCAEAFARHARAAASVEESLQRTPRAADAWREAAQPLKAQAVWDEAVGRFPESVPLKFAAGVWLSDYGIAPERAAALLVAAREKGQDVGERVFAVLVRAGRRAEALGEFRRLLGATKDVNVVYQRLAGLHGWPKDVMREMVVGLLGSDAPVLVNGALLTVQNYGLYRQKGFLEAVTAALARPEFPAEARPNAFMCLIQSGRRELPGPGGKRVSVATILDPLFADLDKPERRSLAVQALGYLSSYSFDTEALARTREMLARPELDEASRAAVRTTEIGVLQRTGRAGEALDKLTALLVAAKDDSAAQSPAWLIWHHHVGQGQYGEAAKLRTEFARRFPGSELPRTMDHNLLTQLMSSGRREEAGELAARLVKEEPGSAVWVRTHVNVLASAGAFREAAAALRECLRLNPEPKPAAAAGGKEPSEADRAKLVEEAQKELARIYERHGLIALLARVSAQDAELREAFVKEADAAAKGEDRELRSWTEGALLCLSEAAETEALASRIEKLAAAEPDEPKWPERLARTHLSAGENAKAAAAYGRLIVLRPDRADVLVMLAEIALRAKDAKAAEAWRARALDVLARNPYPLYNQAYAWGQSGRTEWALEAWKRLVARGPYAASGEAAWQAAALARQLNRPKEEAALLMQAALPPGRSYAQNAIQRLGEMLADPVAGPAARPVAVELLTEWMARAGKAPQVPSHAAYFAAELAQRLERIEEAAALYIRAMEAPDGSYASNAQSQLRGLVQNPRAQRSARPMAEKALAGWLRAPEKLSGGLAWAAGELALFLERRDDAIRLTALSARSGHMGAFNTAQTLATLADSPARRSAAAAALRLAVAAKPAWEAAIWTDLLEFLLAEKRGAPDAARAALERLAAAPMENPNHVQEVVNAMAHAGEQYRDRLVEYALNGGGDLGQDWRRNLIQQALNHCGGSDVRALRLYRALVELETGNREDFRRQLIEALVRFDRLDEAVTELRAVGAGRNAYYYHHAWTGVVDAMWAKGPAQQQRQAIELALEGWERLSTPEGQSYVQSMFTKLADLCAKADEQGRLDASVRRTVLDAARAAAREWFAAGASGTQPWYYGPVHGHSFFEKQGLPRETDELARQAAASDDAVRVGRAAQYWQTRGLTGEAKQAWRRVLGLAGGDERNALSQLYSLSAHAGPQEWDSALGYLERLQKLGVYAGENYLVERARCLYGLKRGDEAREAVGKLLASSSAMLQFQQGNYYWFDSVAGICQEAGDWKTAAEAWEASIRGWRFLNMRHPGSYWQNLVQAYQRAAGAYAEAGDGGKSLECYLRGLSVIPREQSGYYQNLLDAALAQLLKGRTLKQVVAEYEKGVDASGGAEKPHLRIAFAQAYAREGATAEQLRNLRIAADLLPKDMALRAQVIEGYKALKDEQAVVGAYLSWAKVDQQNLDLWRGLGDYYASIGKNDEALVAWATMAEVRPREAEGFRAYAQKLVGAGRDEPAASALRKALRHRPTSFDVASELAEVYKRLKQEKATAELWVSGEKACRQAMEDFADDPTPWLSLGRFLTAQGRKDDARDVYRKILGRSWPRFQSETHSEAQGLLNAN